MTILTPREAAPSTIGDRSELTSEQLVKVLNSYLQEAQNARKEGIFARDAVWEKNIKAYWSDFDFSEKENWQAKEILPEAPLFVDRWAAAMREALVSSDDWFSVINIPKDKEGDLSDAIKKAMRVWLRKVGRSPQGHPLPFESIFEELMKMAALLNPALVVVPKTDTHGAYISVELEDPRRVWLDHTGRNLYRIRQYSVDKYQLDKMKKMKAGDDDIFNTEVIEQLQHQIEEDERKQREVLSQHGQDITTKRNPVILHEFYATILDEEGKVAHSKALCVIANGRWLIRGPEKNPFWHKQDWLVTSPVILVPLSVYGRTYVENWAPIAAAFNEMTNLILDGVTTSTLNAYAMDASKLEDPTEIEEGVSPNKVFQVAEGESVGDLIEEIELGKLPAESLRVWTALKEELREGALFNEIALGQIPPKGDITATEVLESKQGGTALLRSVARTIEERIINVSLNLVWKLGLQTMREDDIELREAMGEAMFDAVFARRREFAQSTISFDARGISSVIERGSKLRSLLSSAQTFAQNETLAGVFFQTISPQIFVQEVLRLSGIDIADFQPTDRERRLEALAQGQQQATAGAGGALPSQVTEGTEGGERSREAASSVVEGA